MPVEKGSKTRLVMYDEPTTYGTPATNGLRLPFTNFSGSKTQSLIESEELTGVRDRRRPYLDEIGFGGDTTLEVDSRACAHVFRHAIALPTTQVDTPSVGLHTHTYKPGDLPIGFTLEKQFLTTANYFRSNGDRFNRFALDVASGGILRMPFAVIGSDEARNATALDAAPILYGKNVFRIPVLTFSEGGAAFGHGLRFTLEYLNNLEERRFMAGGGKVGELPEGLATIRGTFSSAFKDMLTLDKALNNVETAFIATFPSTTANHSLQIEMQEVAFEVTTPSVGGMGMVTVDLSWYAYLDDGAAASSFIMRLVNDLNPVSSIPA